MADKKTPDGVAVTFARDWVIGDKKYQADQDAVLDPADVDAVLRYGYARPQDPNLARAYGFPVPADKKGAVTNG